MPAITLEVIKKNTDIAVANGINRLCDIIAKKTSADGDVIAAFKFLLELRGERDVTPTIDDLPTPTAPPSIAPSKPGKVAVKI